MTDPIDDRWREKYYDKCEELNKIEAERDALQAKYAKALKALREIRSGSGRTEILGLEMFRCPQCAAADISAEALKELGE